MTRSSAILIPLAFLLFSLQAHAQSSPYLRFAGGFEQSFSTVVRDTDCSSTQPPALFGCVAGNDGRAIGARGDFGTSKAGSVAVGMELTPRARVELAGAFRRGMKLDAEANFTGVAGAQPVSADLETDSLMIVGTYELAPPSIRVRPFVSGGAGIARNEIGRVTYSFPSISPDAVTVTAGGSDTSLAWTVASGATMTLTDHLAIDLALRYSDHGVATTDEGEATIIRPTRTLTLDIGGTRAAVETLGVELGLRWRI